MLTEKGAISIQAIAIFSFLSWISGNPTLVTASLTLIMLLLVDTVEFMISRHFVGEIRIERVIQKLKLQVDDDVDVQLTISNVKNCGTSFLFEDNIPPELGLSSGSNLSVLSSNRADAIKIHYRVQAHQMGEYELGHVNMIIRDGLGLMTGVTTLNNRTKVEVYPRIKMTYPQLVPKIPIRARSASFGQRSILELGRGSDFYGVRDYHPGDELKHVVWKAVARTPEHTLMTREYEAEKDQHFILAFHAKRSLLDGAVGQRKLDIVVEGIIAMVHAACSESVWLSVAFGNQVLPLATPGRGRDRQLANALTSLYNILPSDSFKLRKLVEAILLNARRRSIIIFVTDSEYNNAADLLALRPLVESNRVIIVVIKTTSLFQKPSHPEAESCYELLLEREKTSLEQIAQVCSQMGIPFQDCNASDLLKVLQTACTFRGV
ncbi:MAG TPA: DUF58 domain-containing protein [Candidatus Bathyarchaeia archaeon]|nr:DUF58 domain-containing protein [Candidatus Bathyarchaeia archaeon]